MNAQKYLQIALLGIICVVVAIVGYALFLNEDSRKHIEKMEASQYSVLKTTRADYRAIHSSLDDADITVKALWTVDVKAQQEGVLTEIFADAGQTVTENDLLARMTNEELGAQLASAQASIEEARANLLNSEQTLARYQRLIEYNATSRQDYDNAVAQRDAAKAQLDNRIAQRNMTQANMSKLDVYAPNSAVVVSIYHKAGDYVRAGEPIFLLSDFSELQGYAVMKHGELKALLSHGTDFILEIPAYRLTHRIYPLSQSPQRVEGLEHNQFSARVENISPSLSEKADYHEVTWRIANSSEILEPTYYNGVTFSAVAEQKVLTVPLSAIQVDGKKFFAYGIDADSCLIKIPVTVGINDGEFVEITSGLNAGDFVVNDDLSSYSEGMKVKASTDGGQ